MSKTINVGANEFEAKVIKSVTPVLVDFWAEWCGPCRLMGPILDEVSDKYDGKLTIAKVDVDDPANRLLAIKYQVRGIPNMKLFKGGEIVHEIVGYTEKAALEKEISSYLK